MAGTSSVGASVGTVGVPRFSIVILWIVVLLPRVVDFTPGLGLISTDVG